MPTKKTTAMTPSTSIDVDAPFPADSVMWQVSREWCLLAGGPSAVILQAAHPVVAKGVMAFSRFQEAPFTRLFRTLDTVYAITFGTKAEAGRIQTRMVALHRGIEGPGFSGLDADAQFWVLATLIMASVTGYERVYGSLSGHQRQRFYDDMKHFGTFFGLAPGTGPVTWNDFTAYYQSMVEGDILGSDDACRSVAHSIVYARRPWYLFFLMPLVRGPLVEQVPYPLRERLGLHSTVWTRLSWRLVRCLLRSMRYWPKPLKWTPHYRRRMQR